MIHRSLPSHPPFINPFIDASERFDPRLVHDTHSSTGTPRLTNHDDHRSSSIARTKDSSIRPPVSSLVQRRDPERSSRWRARVETESGPRIRSRQRANSGEKNILGTRRQPVNQPDYAARGTRRITCRSRGNRRRIELSGRTIPFQISFTTIHLSYISTECPPAPSYNRYITRHVALKREKKRGRRSRGRRGKRESIDVVGSLHRFTSAQNTNNKLATPSFATFWHDDFVFGQRVTREMTGWRGGDGGRWQARPNITRRWWR